MKSAVPVKVQSPSGVSDHMQHSQSSACWLFFFIFLLSRSRGVTSLLFNFKVVTISFKYFQVGKRKGDCRANTCSRTRGRAKTRRRSIAGKGGLIEVPPPLPLSTSKAVLIIASVELCCVEICDLFQLNWRS